MDYRQILSFGQSLRQRGLCDFMEKPIPVFTAMSSVYILIINMYFFNIENRQKYFVLIKKAS